MWDHLALLGPRRRSAHPRLERVCSLSVCQLFRLSRFVPDFNVSGKTAEPKMAFNFAPLLSAAWGAAARYLSAFFFKTYGRISRFLVLGSPRPCQNLSGAIVPGHSDAAGATVPGHSKQPGRSSNSI